MLWLVPEAILLLRKRSYLQNLSQRCLTMTISCFLHYDSAAIDQTQVHLLMA